MPKKAEGLRVLSIHAHPDDTEFQCAGTLALLKEQGAKITIVTLTPGDCGSAELSPAEISRLRREEAKRAAAIIDADYICLEFRDLSVVFDNPTRRRVAEVLRRTQPDIVFTAPPIDYMADHEITSQLLRDGCFNAATPNYCTFEPNPAPALKKIPHLYYVDAVDGIDYFGNPIEPEFVIDISSSFELKLKMLSCHESQRSWLMKHHGVDEYLEACRRNSAARGRLIGVEYGEGFRQHKGHPYPTKNVLLELLPGCKVGLTGSATK
ncbi:MAG TPA: PIG-L family deacetylase [Planctomycetaceae bacterium]|nr:PIG-L family deacetylase [Planctomycetaceae bacterium]